jgi:hypothetical protein
MRKEERWKKVYAYLAEEKVLLLLSLVLVFSFFGGSLYVQHVNDTNYERCIYSARNTVLEGFAKNNLVVNTSEPDFGPEFTLMETDSFGVFLNKCNLMNASCVYDSGRHSFYVMLPKYHQIWEYGIMIRKTRESPNPFFDYVWVNSIQG